MIGLKNSYEIAYNGTENECRFELYADTAADLQGVTHFDGIKIQMGSECTDISTGDKYLLNGSGVWVLQPSENMWVNVYTKEQVDTMYNTLYQTMLYYHTVQTSTDGTITFYAFAGFVGSLTIYGNGQQNGTPSPDNIIIPDFCGEFYGTDWTIPITCAGQTVPVYLGQTQTVRRVKKYEFTGQEADLQLQAAIAGTNAIQIPTTINDYKREPFICSHMIVTNSSSGSQTHGFYGQKLTLCFALSMGLDTLEKMRDYLQQQYAAGTPVTVWYILATPETAIVNEPLAKIGDYADVLPLSDVLAPIPTVDGENTLTIDTAITPSKIEISGER
jgi:hypothetical protein